MHQERDIAILTADFVASSKLPSEKRKRLPELVFEAISECFGPKQKFEIFRGDSFQIRIENPALSFSNAICLRLFFRLKGKYLQISDLDTRISIGIGPEMVHKAAVGKSDGIAHQLSGYGLDEMAAGVRLSVRQTNAAQQIFWDTIVPFVDDLLQRLSHTQAEAAFWALLGKNQDEIASMLHISQAAVNQRLKSSRITLLKQAIMCFEQQTGLI